MFRLGRFCSMVVLFVTGVLVSPALALEPYCGNQDSGAVYRIYFPDKFEDWNGDLVIFAHSYVPPAAPGTPLEIKDSELTIADEFLPDLFTGRGYAFAVTSYSKTGLAIIQGVADIVDLTGIFKATWENPKHIYLVGVSQGGLVCTLALEQNPGIFSGGLSLCGPIGDFRRQINYWTDFRVVFDYFFPEIHLGSAVGIPGYVMQYWTSVYENQVLSAIITNQDDTAGQLLRVAGAAIDPSDPTTSLKTVIGLLRYNVFSTNDGKATLLGQPFDNLDRIYSGSDNDTILNRDVQRFKADTTALQEIQANYETSGHLNRPLVSMHTIYDPIVPYWHEALYQKKITQNGLASNYIGIPVYRYGHAICTADEVLAGFDLLVNRVKGNKLVGE
jgi:pimeloyl-ACP methyl ester carboxylesterase